MALPRRAPTPSRHSLGRIISPPQQGQSAVCYSLHCGAAGMGDRDRADDDRRGGGFGKPRFLSWWVV